MGKFISARGFTMDLGSLYNIPIAIFLYAYNAANSKTIILESYSSIYLCEKIYDSLLNPIQAEKVGIRVDTRPKPYFMDDPSEQLVSFTDVTTMSVVYYGLLMYLPIRILTKDELHICRRLQLSSRYPWYTFLLNGKCSRMESLIGYIESE